MNREEAEELTQAVGQSVSGAWRTIASLKRLGVPKALGISTEEWVSKRLGGYVKLSINERREAVAELKAEGASNREVASVLGVDERSVRRDASAAFAASDDYEDAPDKAFDEDCAANAAPVASEGAPDCHDEPEDDWQQQDFEPIDAVAALGVTSEQIQEAKAHNHRAQGTGENEWYTPAEYVDAARNVLGCIDLDPASSDIANSTVKAARYFTKKDNGLSKNWIGSVYLNPPFSQPEIQLFADKLVEEVRIGNVTQAVALTHNYSDTKWFHTMARIADAICFTKGRIRFIDPVGNIASATQGQTFFYYGPNRNNFAYAFSAHGIVMVRP